MMLARVQTTKVVLGAALALLVACKADIPRPVGDDAGTPAGTTGLPMPDAEAPPIDAAPTCGLGGQGCCPGNVCLGGGCCVGGMCAANGTLCSATDTCLDGSCGGCGAAPMGQSQACCAARACTASRTACAGDGAGTCQACGGADQLCCGDGFCEAGLVCDRTQMPDARCARP